MVSEGFKGVDDLRKSKNIKDYLNDTQLKGLQYYDDMQVRIPYKEIEKYEIYLKDVLHKIDPKAELTIAGSYRRKRPDSGDIDLLLKASNKRIYDIFIDTLVQEGYLTCQLARVVRNIWGWVRLIYACVVVELILCIRSRKNTHLLSCILLDKVILM